MTTPVRQMATSELENLNKVSTFERVLYVIRRWPLIPMLILGVLIICALFAPLIAPYDPEKDQLRAVLASPPWYPACEEGQITNKALSCNTNGIELGPKKDVYYFTLGADQLGRDLLSRIIFGARLSLSLVAVAVIVGTVFGTMVGLIAGFYGGVVDELIMRTVDVFNSIPYLLLAIALVFVLGQSFAVVAFVLALGAWGGLRVSCEGRRCKFGISTLLLSLKLRGHPQLGSWSSTCCRLSPTRLSSRQRFRSEAPSSLKAYCHFWALACLRQRLHGVQTSRSAGNTWGRPGG